MQAGLGTDVWIGLDEREREVYGEKIGGLGSSAWIAADKREIDYIHWARDKPSGQGSCVAFTGASGFRWVDVDCAGKGTFVCKRGGGHVAGYTMVSGGGVCEKYTNRYEMDIFTLDDCKRYCDMKPDCQYFMWTFADHNRLKCRTATYAQCSRLLGDEYQLFMKGKPPTLVGINCSCLEITFEMHS